MKKIILCWLVVFQICNASPRIINGEKVGKNETPPFIAALYSDNRVSWETFYCTGTLIAPGIILTAAHCALGSVEDQTVVSVGSRKLTAQNKVAKVIDYVLHPDYNDITAENDVALLVLDIKLTSKKYPKLAKRIFKQGTGTSYGWGLTVSWDHYSIPEMLRKVDLPLFTQRECENFYGPYFSSDSMVCAGVLSESDLLITGKDTCNGDSGGPMIVRGKLYAVTSWGFECASPYWPGVYASIAPARDWILNTINGINQ